MRGGTVLTVSGREEKDFHSERGTLVQGGKKNSKGKRGYILQKKSALLYLGRGKMRLSALSKKREGMPGANILVDLFMSQGGEGSPTQWIAEKERKLLSRELRGNAIWGRGDPPWETILKSLSHLSGSFEERCPLADREG